MRAPDQSEDRPSLRITFRRVHSEQVGEQKALVAFCPRRLATVPLAECRKCEQCKGLCIDPSDRETFLRCAWDDVSPRPPDELAPTPEGATTASARATPLCAVMSTPVRCATADMSLQTLTELLLSARISAVPVVNGDGKPVGIVSKTDVLRHHHEDGELAVVEATPIDEAEGYSIELGPGFHAERMADAKVADVMTHMVFCLDRHTSISQAAALMAYEGVHRLLVTGDAGIAVGIVSSLDVLRWLARVDGYVIPDLTRTEVD